MIPLTLVYSGSIIRFGTAVLASVALSLSIYANLRCTLVKPKGFGLASSLFPVTPQSIGLWCFEASNGSFYDIRNIRSGDVFRASRAMGVVTIIIGFIAVAFYFAACCIRMPSHAFAGVGVLSLLICLFQGFVLLVFKSTLCAVGCSLDTGGKCAVAATVFWFLAGVSSFAAGRDAKDQGPPTPVEKAETD